MITNARSKGDLLGALDGEPLLNARHLNKGNQAPYAEPAIHSSKEFDAIRLRYRLGSGQSAGVSAESLSIKTGMTKAASSETPHTAQSRAAANVTTWRSYLPEDCVVAMINDRWHWST
jgi:hypothetical protein